MILNNKRQADSESFGVEESTLMTIDTSDQAALMAILSENLYKDPIGSLIRESVSNALDAQRKAKSTDPIIVSLKREVGGYRTIFKVQDFGDGISPDDVKNVLSKYAASTKRGSDDYLGYYGLGFKAPLAYVDSFRFTTISQGRKWEYIMYKSEEGTKIDLITDTEDKSSKTGTTVSIQLKSEYDVNQFMSKISEQLAYFEGVYFDIPGFNNNFKIFKTEDWVRSQLIPTSLHVHICLDNVYYAIDWSRLGMTPVSIPIGLRFKITDGLVPVPSREDIKYTEEAKALIKTKIGKVADYFITEFNKSITEVNTFKEIYNKFNQTTVRINDEFYVDVKPLTKLSAILIKRPTLKGIKYLDLERLASYHNLMFSNYETRGKISGGAFYGKDGRYSGSSPDLISYNSALQIIRADETPKGLELEYLKEKFPYSTFLYKKEDMKLGDTELINYGNYGEEQPRTYMQLLKLKQYPKYQWREVIKEFQSIRDEILSEFQTVEDNQWTPEWLAERKLRRAKGVRSTVGKQSITLKIARRAQRGDNKLTFDSQIIKIDEVGKQLKSLVVYTNTANKGDLEKIWIMATPPEVGRSRATLAYLSKYDIKKIKDLHNFISMEDFMEGKTRPFKALASGTLIKRLIVENKKVFDQIEFVNILSSHIASKMVDLLEYVKENRPDTYRKDIEDDILEVAEENNLFDENIMDIYKEVNENIHTFDFIAQLKINPSYSEDYLKCLAISREILKARKFRMDWVNYTATPNPIINDNEGFFEENIDEDDEDDWDSTDDEIVHIGSNLQSLEPIDITEELKVADNAGVLEETDLQF